MGLSEQERQSFSNNGVLQLRGAVARKTAEAARRAILGEFARLGLAAGSKLPAKLHDLPPFQQTARLGQMVNVTREIEALFAPDLLSAMASVLPGARVPTRTQPQLLLTFPQKQAWSTEGLSWHLDLKVPAVDEVSGVQAFVLIDAVRPRGGATLALAGSHRLHYAKEAAGNAHTLLRRHGSVEALGAYGVSLVEMSGAAGDVYLMDMRTLHAPSINASRDVRMMATVRLSRG